MSVCQRSWAQFPAGGLGVAFVATGPGHRINTQPEVRLRVGAFDVGVLVFSAAAIFLASVHGKCLRYTEDVDAVFTKKNSSLFTLERGQ